MNISSISFCGNKNQSKYTYRDTESQRYVDELRREAGFDSYQKSAESTVINTSRKPQHHHNPYKILSQIYFHTYIYESRFVNQ